MDFGLGLVGFLLVVWVLLFDCLVVFLEFFFVCVLLVGLFNERGNTPTPKPLTWTAKRLNVHIKVLSLTICDFYYFIIIYHLLLHTVRSRGGGLWQRHLMTVSRVLI